MQAHRYGSHLALTGAFFIVTAVGTSGCDGERGGDDAGRDSGLALMDSGPRPDSGGPADGGGGGMDSGGSTTSCGPTMCVMMPRDPCCNVAAPDSCGTGEACIMIGSSDTSWETACVPSGTRGQGEACEPGTPGQCQEGFQCTNDNVCQRICCSNSDCGPGVLCQQISGADAGYCVSSDACDVTDPDSCGAGMGCYPLGDEGDTQCLAAGTSGEGEACAALNACVAAHGCVGDPGACRAYCNPDSPMCADGFTCAGIRGSSGQPIPGIGVCVPMT